MSLHESSVVPESHCESLERISEYNHVASAEVHESKGDGGEMKPQMRKKVGRVAYWRLYEEADAFDVVLIVVGTITAVISGFVTPAMFFLLGRLIHDLGSFQNNANDVFHPHNLNKNATYLVWIGIMAFIFCYLETACWMLSGDRQAAKIRSKYLRSVLRQNEGFFDTQISTAEVINTVSTDIQIVQEAISEKVGNFILSISFFSGGMLLAFLQTWKLALFMLPFLPLLLLPGFFYARAIIQLATRRQAAYTEAEAVAEQALSSIRTVYSFVAESKTLESFSKALESTVKVGVKQGLAKGLAMGSNGISYGLWAVMSWYGSRLVQRGEANGSMVLSSGFGIITGGLALGNIAPNLRAFSEGCVAAYKIFELIECVPSIDIDNLEGRVLDKVEGRLQLKDVEFVYPSRPEQLILRNFNLEIPDGKTVALVGSSGCGKSTVIALLERFYDPSKGCVLLDGVDIKELQLRWFRKQIGLVSQEPALFATSIKENILYGKEDAEMEEVISVAKLSNAHEFIQRLPLQYGTLVGERGIQMSGGQKQRIAISRALIRDPKILLLDEATSALDSESELIVQDALERATIGRTTVVIAHRLSTVRNADIIAVLHQGRVIELGNHEELLAKGNLGAYSALVSSQQSEDHDKSPSNDEISDMHHHHQGVDLPAINLVADNSLEAEKDQESSNKKKEYPQVPSFSRLLALNRPEWKQGLLGLIGSIGFGFTQPFYMFLLGNMVVSTYNPNGVESQKTKLYSSIFVCLGLASFIVNLTQHYSYGVMGEYLTKRIRESMLAAILQFEVGWFDRDENLSGSICSRLSSDANMIRTFIGDQLALFAQTTSAITVSLVIGFTASWRLTSLLVVLQPLIIACFYFRKVGVQGSAQNIAKAQQEASQMAGEAVSHHRTITALCSQDRVLQIFHEKLGIESEQRWRQAQIAGLTFGASQLFLLSSWALSFWFAGILRKQHKVSFKGIFDSIFVIMSTGRVIGDAGAMTTDWVKSTAALVSVFDILDRKTEIDADSNKNVEVATNLQGSVQLLNVTFAYPSRPDAIIFQNISFEVIVGHSFALVGHSGSGKSSIIGLIQRFYDPIAGKVMLDGRDIRDLHLRSVRNQMGLVSQEPVLFATSIHENIAYGKDNATEEEIVAAARSANAHDFISALPNGYSTHAGERGLQLSGGQKQRICIARAIIKNPVILLLDEATSALDSISESIVQETLSKVMIGRTSIVIAHRLSTIQNAEMIAVIEDGGIVEQGTHTQLLAKGEGGAYYSLHKLKKGIPL